VISRSRFQFLNALFGTRSDGAETYPIWLALPGSFSIWLSGYSRRFPGMAIALIESGKTWEHVEARRY
jgi:hypothetical protein